MKQREHEIIAAMRLAIAQYHTEPVRAQEQLDHAHRLFANHLLEWSDDFAVLQQQMYKIWCAYTPMPTGRYRHRAVEIGYTPHHFNEWINDKRQPPAPTTQELLDRFDRLIAAYIGGEAQTCPHDMKGVLHGH